MNARHSSISVEHFTPPAVIEAARFVMGGIALDPATSKIANTVVKASAIYTAEDNGFTKAWMGTVFLNAPGGKSDNLERRVLIKCEETGECGLPIGHKHEGTESSQKKWWQKLAKEYEAGRVTQALFVGFSVEILQITQVNPTIPVFPLDFPLCFPKNRLAYWREEHDGISGGMKLAEGKSPPHASVLIYLPPRIKDKHSFVWEPKAVACFREAFEKMGRVLVPSNEARDLPEAWKPEPKPTVVGAIPSQPLNASISSSLKDLPEPQAASSDCGTAASPARQENWSDLADALERRGLSVSLTVISEWTAMKRDVANLYAEQGGSIPPFLDEFRTDGGQGCAGCDSGKPFTAETEFLHTGMGPRCRIPLANAAVIITPDPAPVKRGRGRPRKNPLPTSGQATDTLAHSTTPARGLEEAGPAREENHEAKTEKETVQPAQAHAPGLSPQAHAGNQGLDDQGRPLDAVTGVRPREPRSEAEADAQEVAAKLRERVHEIKAEKTPETAAQGASGVGILGNADDASHEPAVSTVVSVPASEVAAPPPLSDFQPKCGTCVHFQRCQWLINRKPDQTGCDWIPTRYQKSLTPSLPATETAQESGTTSSS